MTTDSDGLLWKRIDLHFHTPASQDDYKHLGTTPEQLVANAKQAGLDGFAVTDHNTGAWIDRIEAVANTEGIAVFPGVEVTAFGGERNVHILAIFDPSKGTADVHDFLAQVSITEDIRGSTKALAHGDVNEVIDKIALFGGVPLLAHCDSTSGVTQEIRGEGRIRIIRNPKLLGAEITKDETAAFFSGDDVNYRRKLAVFQGSDCHSPGEVGRRGSYFKLGTMTLAALRQCLYDPNTRIRTVDHPTVQYPTILSMEVTGGFFDGVAVRLHTGLNTIIGGKGVGKSLLGPVHTIGLNMISLEDGTYRSSIRTNSSLSAGATRQREHVEPPSPQRNSVRRRAWLQVAGLASEVWLLAHSLYPHEPLVQKRSPQSGVRTPSTRADSAHQYRGGFGGQHDCQGASRWHGRVKKNGPQSIGKSRGGWTTKIHMVAADARTALMFSLSAGQAHDAPEGRKLLNRLGPQRENLSIVMDRAYEGNETRQLALALGFTPVVPPSSTRVSPWTYDMEMYKRRNEVERLFRRLKGFRRIFSRFEKLDVLFLGFILITLIVDALR